MKTLLALINWYFLIIIFLTITKVNCLHKCRENISEYLVENFDPEKYFSGSWYVSAIEDTNTGYAVLCENRLIKSRTKEGIFIEYSHIYVNNIDVEIMTEKIIEIRQFDDGKSAYNSTIKFIADNQVVQQQAKLIRSEYILNTDYDNYSINYVCIKSYNGHFGYFEILKRNLNHDLSTFLEIIAAELDKYNMDFYTFLQRHDVVCDKLQFTEQSFKMVTEHLYATTTTVATDDYNSL